jgi:hypothetical protein
MSNYSTNCLECVFATWDEKTNVQVGCDLGRLKKLEANGATLKLEQFLGEDVCGCGEGGEDDEDLLSRGKFYYRIEDRFCNACRNQEWGEQTPKSEWVRSVYDKIQITMDIFVDASDVNSNIDNIWETVQSAFCQAILPETVYVVTSDEDLAFGIVQQLRDGAFGKWQVETSSLEDAVKLSKARYHAVFKPGYDIPYNFISDVNDRLNIEMERFVALLPDEDGNGLVVQNCQISIADLIKVDNEYGSGLVKPFGRRVTDVV